MSDFNLATVLAKIKLLENQIKRLEKRIKLNEKHQGLEYDQMTGEMNTVFDEDESFCDIDWNCGEFYK
jgi:hypothetical protein